MNEETLHKLLSSLFIIKYTKLISVMVVAHHSVELTCSLPCILYLPCLQNMTLE